MNKKTLKDIRETEAINKIVHSKECIKLLADSLVNMSISKHSNITKMINEHLDNIVKFEKILQETGFLD